LQIKVELTAPTYSFVFRPIEELHQTKMQKRGRAIWQNLTNAEIKLLY
jgi:hypothetical protein